MGVNKVAPTFSQSSSFTIVDKHIRSLIETYMGEFENRLVSGNVLSDKQKDDMILSIGEYIEGTPIIHHLVNANLQLTKRLEDLENKTFSRTSVPASAIVEDDDRRARIKEKIRNG